MNSERYRQRHKLTLKNKIMKYFKFCKTLTQSLMLIEVSKEPMTAESDKIIVLSEDELNSFNYNYFLFAAPERAA